MTIAWAAPGGWSVRDVVDGYALAWLGDRGQVIAIDDRGRRVWTSGGWVSGFAAFGAQLIASVHVKRRGSLQRIEVASGEVTRELQRPLGIGGRLGADGAVAFGHQDGSVAVLDARNLDVRWERRILPGEGIADGWQLASEFACHENTIIACIFNPETDEGRLVALDGGSGAERWSTRVIDADASGLEPWGVEADAGSVAVSTQAGVSVFSLETGRLRWRAKQLGARALVGGRCYQVRRKSGGGPSEIVVHDLQSGRRVWKRSYAELVDRERITGFLVGRPAVSASHVFVAGTGGTLYAFDAANGDPIWQHRPDELKGSWSYSSGGRPVIAGGRLLIAIEGRPSVVLCYHQAGDQAAGAVEAAGSSSKLARRPRSSAVKKHK